MVTAHLHPSRLASLGVYAVLLVVAFVEQAGKVTSDTRISIILAPVESMRSTFSLWNPLISLGELQNQAYGYLFPMGPFFAAGQLTDVPAWITERLWTTAVIVVGVEGARLVARAIGLGMWPAWFAGMAYGLNARVIGQVATRSAEVLPGAVLPWVVLPVVLALDGRMRPRTAALLSAAAYLFMGAVNATATVAPLPLVVVLLLWGVRTGRVPRSMLLWWGGLVGLASVWWASALLKLGAYSPPFFDFVEDAKVTTLTTGYSPSLRGANNWVTYLNVVDQPGWPAGHDLAYVPLLVVLTTAVGALGVVGLTRMRGPWRQPLLVSAVFALVCLTIGHVSALQSPLAPLLQHLFDGPLAMLRNVHKIDPMWRLPVALGVGAAAAELAARTLPRPRLRAAGAAALALLTLSTAQPALALNLRTPGWEEVPAHWHDVADYLDDQRGNNRAWVIPGVGFGVQQWGWTMDEPMSIVARTPWVTRSQVPLTPPETIRMLTRVETILDTGSGSPYLGRMLARLGLGYVVVRHDLEQSLSEGTASTLVALSMARSRGVERVATFGRLDFGPAIEVYKVEATPAPDLRVEAIEDAATVSSGPSDVIEAVGQGVLNARTPAVVQGDDAWPDAADLVGDTYRLRERNFGRVHDSEGPVRAPTDPREGRRVVPDYPGSPGAEPVYAEYAGIDRVTASSTQASVEALGAVRPETGPYSALDGDPATAWTTETYHVPDDEWLEVRLIEPTRLRTVRISQPVGDLTVSRVQRWRIEAGGVTDEADADPFTGRAILSLQGVEARTVRVTAVRVSDKGSLTSIGISELDLGPDVEVDRTLVVPADDLDRNPTFVFSARPETRACVPTLLGPDCALARARTSDEGPGIDRTVTSPRSGTWTLAGSVVSRSSPASTGLLDPFGGRVTVRASSTYAADPLVSARMLYDGNASTSWIADPRDRNPTLTVTFDRPRTIGRLAVARPAAPGVAPSRMVIRNEDGEVRRGKLDDFGVIQPIRGTRFEILLRNPTRRGAPIGMADLRLDPVKITLPLDGGTETGALCGFGPTVSVGTREYRTRVAGRMGDVLSGGPLQLISCDGPVRLKPGENRIRIASTVQFQPVAVSLTPTGQPAPDPAARRALVEREVTDNREVLTLAPGAESLLSTTRNYNPGWRATLDGEPLAVQRVDGWAQGWVVPEGDGGELVVEYAPQRSYLVGLVGGLVLAGGVLLAALLVLALALVRRRPLLSAPGTHSQPRPAPHHRSLRRSRSRRFLLGQGALAASWVLGGVPAALGMLLAWFGHRVRLPVLPVAVALIALSAVAVVVDNLDGPALATEPANVLAGIAIAALVGAAWPSPFAVRRARETARETAQETAR